MKKKLIAAILTGAMLAAGMSTSVWADGEKSFVYGTTGYSEEMGDAGLNPHDNYSGWSALRYGVGETLFKYNDNMEVEPWLATDYEFVDDTTVKITLRDGVQFSSGRTMDAEAVKECLEDLIAVHDRAPYDLKIDHIDADGLTLTIYTTEPCPAIINYLGDPYGAIIDMDYGIQGEGGSANVWKREEIISGRWGLPEMSWTVRPWELSDSAISRDSLSGCCPVSGWISWHTIPLSGPMSHSIL